MRIMQYTVAYICYICISSNTLLTKGDILRIQYNLRDDMAEI